MLKAEFVQELLNSENVEITNVTGGVFCSFCGISEHKGRHFTTDNTKMTLCDDCGEEMQDVVNERNSTQ